MKSFVMLLLMTNAAAAQIPRVILPDVEPGEAALTDPAALAERIARNSKRASDRLAESKAERETVKDQQQVATDLDDLIRLLSQPPPSSGGGSNTPKDNPPKDDQPKNKPKDDASNSQPKGGEQPKGGQQPKRGDQPNRPPMKPESGKGSQPETAPLPKEAKPGAAGSEPGRGGTSLPDLPIDESLARDFWGHLPDKQREQMLQFYREQYLSKYKNHLADYYKSLAEKEKK